MDTIADATGIEDLYPGAYSSRDLTPLAHLTSLWSLRMKDRPALRCLDGVEAMPWLAHLGIYLAPLEDTTALARTGSPVLTELALASCRRITSLADLSGLTALRELDVSEGRSIQSLGPVAGLLTSSACTSTARQQSRTATCRRCSEWPVCGTCAS